MIHRLVTTSAAALFALALGAATPAQAQAQAAGTPAEVIQNLGAVMIQTMQNAKQLGYEGRFRQLAPAIMGSFDTGRMVAAAVGGAWLKSTSDQHQKLAEAFARYMVAVHASRLDDYSGESFRVLGVAETQARDAVVVKSQFVRRNGSSENIDYVMQNSGQGWKVVDVYYKSAISEVATRRSEYTAVIRRSSVDQLIVAMDAKVVELGNGKSTN
jgi:phospholipid transport system substrate-binding protein